MILKNKIKKRPRVNGNNDIKRKQKIYLEWYAVWNCVLRIPVR